MLYIYQHQSQSQLSYCISVNCIFYKDKQLLTSLFSPVYLYLFQQKQFFKCRHIFADAHRKVLFSIYFNPKQSRNLQIDHKVWRVLGQPFKMHLLSHRSNKKIESKLGISLERTFQATDLNFDQPQDSAALGTSYLGNAQQENLYQGSTGRCAFTFPGFRCSVTPNWIYDKPSQIEHFSMLHMFVCRIINRSNTKRK